jgi:hypothetical protein
MGEILHSVGYYDSYSDEPEKTKYWIYVVINEIYEDFAPIEPFKQLAANFGKKFDDTVKVALPIKSKYKSTRESILKKNWTADFKSVLEMTDQPYWLILKESVRQFDPQKDEHAFLWFSEATENPAQYSRIMCRIENHVRANKDLISWANHHNNKKKYKSALERLYSAVELKPGAFGFCVDLKALVHSESNEPA